MVDDVFSFLNCHINVSHRTFERFILYHNLLLKWQKQVNLISENTIADIWNRHFLDSLQLLKLLPEQPVDRIVDLGSGAGFPGMALAIFGVKNIHLIESDSKKILFLREVARVTETGITIHHCRIEDHPIEVADIIISRACSSLEKLLELSSPYVSHGTICLFHKGKNYTKEIEDANEKWIFNHSIVPSITDHQGVIVNIFHISKRIV